jgi:D-amino-acid dehydrogenase
LAELGQARHLIQPVGWLKVYRTDAGFADTALERALMTRHGVHFEVLNAQQIAALEPGLDPSVYKHGLFQPESGFVNFPMGLAQAYFQAAQARGATQVQEAVLALEPQAGGGVSIRTAQGTQRFDAAVVAAGAWSKQFARQVGDGVCLDTERGYHLSFQTRAAPLLNRPVSFPEDHCVLSPMHDGISLVSGDELAGLKAAPDYRRIRNLIPFARRALPAMGDAVVQREWMGYRPSTPDSLPVIGRSPRCADVFYAFGHGHLGLTLSAITAQLVSAMVDGETAPFDMAPYRINRF